MLAGTKSALSWLCIGLSTGALNLPLASLSQTADSFNPGASDAVTALAVQADGRVVVGGAFTVLGGATRQRLGRLNPDGTLDTAFYPVASNTVNCLAIQPDGKILVGGAFTSLAGQPRRCLGRLNPNGSLDTGFNPSAIGGIVDAFAIQPDGRILVAGAFTNLAGQACKGLGRLYSDGTLDSGFNSDIGTEIYTVALQPDGSILVGGNFTTLAGQPRLKIGRLYSDGGLDTGFDPGAGNSVRSIAVQPDGGILVGGDFPTLGGQSHPFLGRLNSDGTLDTNFTATAVAAVYSLVLQADGRVLVGGNFSTLAGQTRPYLGRVNPDGSLDATFSPTTGNQVRALALQADGKVVVGGYFSTLGGASRSRIGRLNNTSAASETLIYDGASLTWLRGGPSPEVNSVTFEAASNGTDWSVPGTATRIEGGWQLTDVLLGPNDTVRARGLTTGGCYAGSGWYVESGIGPPAMDLQPQDVTAHAGDIVTFCSTATGTAPLGYQWFKDGVAVAGGTNAWLTVSPAQATDNGKSYAVLVTNALGNLRSLEARLWVATADTFNPGPNGAVSAIALQTDGKVLIGGSFTTVAGGARTNLARFNASGSLDTSFKAATDGSVYCLAVQEDGSILVGGGFSQLGGRAHGGLGRLDATGNVDSTFSPSLFGPYPNAAYCLGVQPDGMILVGGSFQKLNGQNCSSLGRLFPDGTIDNSFINTNYWGVGPPTGALVNSLAIQPSGEVWAFGFFSANHSSTYHYYGQRFGGDGSLNGSFFPIDRSSSSQAYACAMQADGKVLVGGFFPAGKTMFLARLNSDGSTDDAFLPSLNGAVYALAVQSDGKILVGGAFTSVNGLARTNLCRLNSDGTLDSTLDLGLSAGSYISALAPQADGKLLVGGTFTTVGGVARRNLGRINATGPTLENFSYDGSSISWSRTGSSPEFWRTSFDGSTDGSAWTSLGAGVSMVGGWQLSTWVADGSLLRGRGTVVSSGVSSWIVQVSTASPSITNQPAGRTNNAGTVAVFRVGVSATPAATYQWLKGGVNLSDAGNIIGSQSSMLMLNNVFGQDAGGYSVVVSNSFGSVTSAVATLTVVDPVLTSQPASVTTNFGASVNFNAMAFGSAPLGYQWLKNGANLVDGGHVTGTHTPSLALTSVLGQDSGSYVLVVSNSFGSLTSAVAVLTVVDPWLQIQPTNFWVNAGDSLVLSVNAAGSAPLRYQWLLSGQALAGATTNSLAFTPVLGTNAGTYRVIVTNAFGSVTGTVANVSVNQALADTFDATADSYIYATAIQPDGKVLVGGVFTNLAGQAHSGLGRFTADGSLDTNFVAEAAGDSVLVNSLVVQSDGRILVGGRFTMLSGQACTNLGRLRADGSFDSSFASGTDFDVEGLIELPDHKLLAWGLFSLLAGQPCEGLGRLNRDGTFDTNFNAGVTGAVYSVTIQPDGMLLVGGSITALGGLPCNNLGRIDANGVLDSTFTPGASAPVATVALQADGRILVGGFFTSLGNQPRNYLGRLNADGTLDPGFNPGPSGACYAFVYSLALQTDGEILVGGGFATLGGQARSCLGRLNLDGSLDTTFNPGLTRSGLCPLAYSLAVGSDGNVLVGGPFDTLAGKPRGYLGRLTATAPATQALTLNGTTLTWIRAGTGPEFWRTGFELSSNGVDWVSLGAGVRTTNGWQASVGVLPPNATIRARGFVSGGYQNSSSWFIESTLQPEARPAILVNDGGFGVRSGRFGFNVRSAPAQAVLIEASTNFVTWTPVQTNIASTLGQVLFSDAASATYRRRFYRASLYQGILPPPSILARDGAFGFRTNRFGFDLTGIGGQTVVVEMSTNLAAWVPLATNILGNAPIYFTDPGSAVAPRRFYRARVQ